MLNIGNCVCLLRIKWIMHKMQILQMQQFNSNQFVAVYWHFDADSGYWQNQFFASLLFQFLASVSSVYWWAFANLWCSKCPVLSPVFCRIHCSSLLHNSFMLASAFCCFWFTTVRPALPRNYFMQNSVLVMIFAFFCCA